MSDYQAEPGDLICQRHGCTNAAQDGWWLLSGTFRFACETHAQAERTSDMPDGILDMPPGFTHDEMNPGNVPTPRSSRASRAAARPIPEGLRKWIHRILRDLNGSDEEIRMIMGEGYTSIDRLSQYAASWLIAELQTAWLAIVPVEDDD